MAIRKWMRRFVVGIALGVPFVLVFLLFSELWLRATTNLPYISRTRCFTQAAKEAPSFLPDCSEEIRTPTGPVSFRTNEDGFRDRPRASFPKGAIALLGDSYVEGFWLAEDEGLARVLERKAGLPFPLLNLGIRGTGPSQQALRLIRAQSNYLIRGVIWFLNPSDPIDEIYFLARNPEFNIEQEGQSEIRSIWDPPRSYWRWTEWSLRFHDRFYLLIYVAEKWIKQGWQRRLIEGKEFQIDLHCRALTYVARDLRKRGIPLLFVGLPHGSFPGRRPYLGREINEGDFEKMLACVKDAGAKVLDYRGSFTGHGDWYWKNDWHFNASGVELVADFIQKGISGVWGKKMRLDGSYD